MNEKVKDAKQLMDPEELVELILRRYQPSLVRYSRDDQETVRIVRAAMFDMLAEHSRQIIEAMPT